MQKPYPINDQNSLLAEVSHDEAKRNEKWPKSAKIDTLFMTKQLKNHTLWGRHTYVAHIRRPHFHNFTIHKRLILRSKHTARKVHTLKKKNNKEALHSQNQKKKSYHRNMYRYSIRWDFYLFFM